MLRRAGLPILAVMLSSCASRPNEPAAPAPAPEPPAVSAPAPASAPAARAASASVARTLDGYKREVAQRIHEVSSERVFAGAPPNPLRSIVVVNIAIDGRGGLIDARVMRDNGDTELTRAALESARRAAPYAAPASALARRGRVEFFETWLFSDDGRFQLRTLAEAQQQ